MDVTLDIVVPTFNPDVRLLAQTIESLSLFVSTKADARVTIVDNGSAVPVAPLLPKAWMNLPNIRFVRFEENLGFSQNLFRASGHASGSWLWFLGDDDLIDPNSVGVDSFSRVPFGTHCVVLETSFFQDGTEPDWSKWAPQEDFWGGSALSSVVFNRVQFQANAPKVLSATQDQLWLHFLVAKTLRRSGTGISLQLQLPKVAVRLGRHANWEAHFGSQYLAGLEAVQKLTQLAAAGLLDAEVAREAFLLRVGSNLGDVATLTANISQQRLKKAASDFKDISVTLGLRFSFFHRAFMLTPRIIRSLLARFIQLLSRAKARIK